MTPRSLRALACAVMIMLAGGPGALAADGLAEGRVRIETGRLQGEVRENAVVFRNIPFAAPPVGPLRWAPPQRAPAWDDLRDARQLGPSCPQPMRPDGRPNFGGANGGASEDCLQLNVFAPPKARRAPVMVWLHGGAHRYGAGWIYDGSSFARDGVVLVSINYRLGPLGAFAHPALTREAGTSNPLGNYGLMDQLAALEWVQRNIAAFGGDPGNVTLFGESAGAMSTLVLLTLPQAKGLFHKAIVQSGAGFGPSRGLQDMEAQGARLAAQLGLPADPAPSVLRSVPVEALVEASEEGTWSPFVDGRLVVEAPAQAFAAGRELEVPLIIGSNSGEDSLMAGAGAGAAAAAPARLRALYPGLDDEAAARAMFTDRVMGAPARWIARQAADGAPSWLYYFNYVGSRFRPGTRTAAHAAEIQYVFEYWGRRTDPATITQSDRDMASLMHGCWTSFAKTSQPKCPQGVAWPEFDARTQTLLEFSDVSGPRPGFRAPQLDAHEAMALRRLGLAH